MNLNFIGISGVLDLLPSRERRKYICKVQKCAVLLHW